MPTRNGKQIRDRYLNYLDPKIIKAKFNEEEDKKIIELYIVHGSKWAVIAKSFPGRTGDMIKNRFHSCLRKRVHFYDTPKNKKNRKKVAINFTIKTEEDTEKHNKNYLKQKFDSINSFGFNHSAFQPTNQTLNSKISTTSLETSNESDNKDSNKMMSPMFMNSLIHQKGDMVIGNYFHNINIIDNLNKVLLLEHLLHNNSNMNFSVNKFDYNSH